MTCEYYRKSKFLVAEETMIIYRRRPDRNRILPQGNEASQEGVGVVPKRQVAVAEEAIDKERKIQVKHTSIRPRGNWIIMVKVKTFWMNP